MLEEFLKSPNFDLGEASMAIGFSLVASVIACLMYHVFYGSRNIGAGVDRTFLVGGPAITALFLGIQSSIPLSLGLLGALSFVRFRTPVKDPAEIGFLLLLIASSIGAATKNFLITIILFLVVFLSMAVQWLLHNRFSFRGQANLMLSVDKAVFPEIKTDLTEYLQGRCRNLRLITISVMEDRISIRYQYRAMSDLDKMAFITDINNLVEPGKIEVFLQ